MLLPISLAALVFSLQWRPAPTSLRQSAAFFPWEPVGPNNLGHNLIAGLRVGNTLYVGSAFGGLFRSTDGGRSWEVVSGFTLNTNDAPEYRCPSVTALAAKGNTLLVGTGAITQYNPAGIGLASIGTAKGGLLGAFGRPGMGVFVSTDGGATFSNQNATWKLTPPATSYTLDYNNVGILNTVALSVSPSGKIAILTPDTLLLSTDDLATLQGTGRLAGGRRLRSVAWGANDVLYFTTSDSLYRSDDGGASFTPVTGLQLPPGLTGVGGIGGGNAVVRTAPSDPTRIYVASAKSDGSLVGVWASPDNGATWARIANQENASFAVLGTVGAAALTLVVDPTDPTHIVLGGNQLWEFSPEKGWQRITPANQDPLILRLPSLIRDVVFLEGGDLLVIGDGRLVRVTQNNTRIEDANRGIQASRILSVAVSPLGDVHISGVTPVVISSNYAEDPRGTFRLVNGITTVFDAVATPLGHVQVSQLVPDFVFFSYQDGRLRGSQDRGQGYVSFYAPPYSTSWDNAEIQPPGTGSGTPAWISQDRPERYGPLYPPFALIEKIPADGLVKDANNTFLGTSLLFIATGQGLWTITNPISTSPDTIARWNRVSGSTPLGVNASHTYAAYFTAANSIPTALAVDSAYTVWVGTSNGKLFRLRNAHDITINRTVQDGLEDLTASINSLVDGRYISAIAVHPRNPNLLAVAVGSYAGPAERIFISTNATANTPTFTAIRGNLPDVPVYSLFFYPDSSALLFAGTEWGLWRCLDVTSSTLTWEEMTGEAIGRVPVTSITWKPYIYRSDTLDSNPDNPRTEGRLIPDPEKPIYISTWGRGVWKLSSRFATALPATSPAAAIQVQAYPNPFSEEIRLQLTLPQGARYVRWELYSIDGRRMGAHNYSQPLPAGIHTLTWTPTPLSAGLYLLKVEIHDGRQRYTHTLKLLH